MKRYLLTFLAGMFLAVSTAMAGNMPPGIWDFKITLDGFDWDKHSGVWPGYATTVVSDDVVVHSELPGPEPWSPKRERDFHGHVLMTSGKTPPAVQ